MVLVRLLAYYFYSVLKPVPQKKNALKLKASMQKSKSNVNPMNFLLGERLENVMQEGESTVRFFRFHSHNVLKSHVLHGSSSNDFRLRQGRKYWPMVYLLTLWRKVPFENIVEKGENPDN